MDSPGTGLLDELLIDLNKAGQEYTLYEHSSQEADAINNLLEQRYPIESWGRVRWQDIPNTKCISYKSESELVSEFEKLCQQENIRGSVYVIWFDLHSPVMQLMLNVAIQHAAKLFQVDWDTWIISQEEDWCVENYHEGELCFGRVNN